MSIITTTRRPVNTTVLFDATQRHPAPRDFGRGILRSLPTDRMPFTAEDEAAAAQMFGELSDALDAELEFRAIDAYAQDCLDRGVMPSDVAEWIAGTRIGGHMA